MKMHQKMRGGFTLVELLVVIVIIAALAGLTAPMVMRSRKKADQTEAINNAKNIGLAMMEFETEYARYPDEETADDVAENTGGTAVTGSTANDLFRQLIAAGMTQSEKMFYAKVSGAKKPDDNIQDDEALAQGEVGFGYILKGDRGFSASGNPSRPLVFTPLFENATDGTFDKEPFDSKAIILRMDNSASAVPIREDKTIRLGGTDGDWLATGEDTVWGEITDTPTIIAPDIE